MRPCRRVAIEGRALQVDRVRAQARGEGGEGQWSEILQRGGVHQEAPAPVPHLHACGAHAFGAVEDAGIVAIAETRAAAPRRIPEGRGEQVVQVCGARGGARLGGVDQRFEQIDQRS